MGLRLLMRLQREGIGRKIQYSHRTHEGGISNLGGGLLDRGPAGSIARRLAGDMEDDEVRTRDGGAAGAFGEGTVEAGREAAGLRRAGSPGGRWRPLVVMTMGDTL